eukprot:GSChrysophyteH1.ASY1.ANO1.970.1 assembled CDS
MGIKEKHTAQLEGNVNPEKRSELWNDPSRRVFFCTPQTLHNDLKSGRAPPKRIVCAELERGGAKFRVLALSATPGADMRKVQETIRHLRIEDMQVRTEGHEDLLPYKQDRFIQEIHVAEGGAESSLAMLTKEIKLCCMLPAGQELYSIGLLTYDPAQIPNSLNSLAADEAQRQLSGQIKKAKDALFRLKQSLGSKDESSPSAPLLQKILAPKIAALQTLLISHFREAGENKSSSGVSRVIVFANLRATVHEICTALENAEEVSASGSPLLMAKGFVGQANKTSVKGQTQQEQQAVLDLFNKGRTCNILIATSIAEEGLDIDEVDLIVFFDVTTSPVRTVQRMGRTGRKRAGRIVILLQGDREVDKYEQSRRSSDGIQKALGVAVKTKQLKMHPPRGHVLPADAHQHCEMHQAHMEIDEFHLSQIAGRSNKPLPDSPAKPETAPIGSFFEKNQHQQSEKSAMRWRDESAAPASRKYDDLDIPDLCTDDRNYADSSAEKNFQGVETSSPNNKILACDMCNTAFPLQDDKDEAQPMCPDCYRMMEESALYADEHHDPQKASLLPLEDDDVLEYNNMLRDYKQRSTEVQAPEGDEKEAFSGATDHEWTLYFDKDQGVTVKSGAEVLPNWVVPDGRVAHAAEVDTTVAVRTRASGFVLPATQSSDENEDTSENEMAGTQECDSDNDPSEEAGQAPLGALSANSSFSSARIKSSSKHRNVWRSSVNEGFVLPDSQDSEDDMDSSQIVSQVSLQGVRSRNLEPIALDKPALGMVSKGFILPPSQDSSDEELGSGDLLDLTQTDTPMKASFNFAIPGSGDSGATRSSLKNYPSSSSPHVDYHNDGDSDDDLLQSTSQKRSSGSSQPSKAKRGSQTPDETGLARRKSTELASQKRKAGKSGGASPTTANKNAAKRTSGSWSSQSASQTQYSEDDDEEGIPCCICLHTDSEKHDPIFFCDGPCGQGVHRNCVGLPKVPRGKYYCKACNPENHNRKVACVLCRREDGYMTKSKQGQFTHPVCVYWMRELHVDEQGRAVNIHRDLDPKRKNLSCVVCDRGGGVTQCAYGRCMAAFHPHCAYSTTNAPGVQYGIPAAAEYANQPGGGAMLTIRFKDDGDDRKYELFCPVHKHKVRPHKLLYSSVPEVTDVPLTPHPDATPMQESPISPDSDAKALYDPTQTSNRKQRSRLRRERQDRSRQEESKRIRREKRDTLRQKLNKKRGSNLTTMMFELEAEESEISDSGDDSSNKELSPRKRKRKETVEASFSEDSQEILSGDFINDSQYTLPSPSGEVDRGSMALYYQVNAGKQSQTPSSIQSESPHRANRDTGTRGPRNGLRHLKSHIHELEKRAQRKSNKQKTMESRKAEMEELQIGAVLKHQGRAAAEEVLSSNEEEESDGDIAAVTKPQKTTIGDESTASPSPEASFSMQDPESDSLGNSQRHLRPRSSPRTRSGDIPNNFTNRQGGSRIEPSSYSGNAMKRVAPPANPSRGSKKRVPLQSMPSQADRAASQVGGDNGRSAPGGASEESLGAGDITELSQVESGLSSAEKALLTNDW